MTDPSDPTAIPLARPVAIPLAGPVTSDNPLLLMPLSRLRAGIHLLVLLAAFFACMVIFAIIVVVRGAPAEEVTVEPATALLGTLTAWVILILLGLVLLRNADCSARSIGLTTHRPGINSALGLAVTAATFASFYLSYVLLVLFLPEAKAQLQENSNKVQDMLPDLSDGGMLVLMLAVAFCEEIVFRGFLLTHLRRLTGSWPIAVVLSSAIFAALHIEAQMAVVVIPLFVVGVVWSLFVIWRRTLWPTIVGHALFNFLQVVLLHWTTHLSEQAR